MEIKGLDDDFSEEMVELLSKDNKRFSITCSMAKMSTYFKNIIDMDMTTREIQLPYIHSTTIEKLVSWMEYHKNIPPMTISRPLPHSNLKTIVGSWDADFMDCDLDLIYDLLLASNFLGILSLLELCCAKIASLMIGKTPNNIRDVFGLPEDFNPEEEIAFQKKFANYL